MSKPDMPETPVKLEAFRMQLLQYGYRADEAESICSIALHHFGQLERDLSAAREEIERLRQELTDCRTGTECLAEQFCERGDEIERLTHDSREAHDVMDAATENEKKLQQQLASRDATLTEAVGLLRKPNEAEYIEEWIESGFDDWNDERLKFLARLDAEKAGERDRIHKPE